MMRKLSHFCFFTFLALFSCSQPVKEFNIKEDFSILNIKKSIDHQSSTSDTTICKEWNLTETEIIKIIESAKPISGPDWHYMFDYLPCRIEGKLKQADNEFDLSINSGAWFTITSADTSMIFGDFNEKNNKLFLSNAWTEADK